MTTTLNKYTIDDFIKLKPVIYEYCVNLTQKKTTTSWFRDFADADDLYQEVFIYIHDNFFNKSIEPMVEGKFIQIMKNYTYWTYQRRSTRKGAKLYKSLSRIDHFTPENLFFFEQVRCEYGTGYSDFTETIDFKYYTKTLNPIEIKAIHLYLEGYCIREIDEKFNKYLGWFEYLMRRKLRKIIEEDRVKPVKLVKVPLSKKVSLKEDNVEFLKFKVPSYDNVFNFKKSNDKFIKMYSLYLQGVSLSDLSEEFKTSKHQISVELFRIKQKIKKYE